MCHYIISGNDYSIRVEDLIDVHMRSRMATVEWGSLFFLKKALNYDIAPTLIGELNCSNSEVYFRFGFRFLISILC